MNKKNKKLCDKMCRVIDTSEDKHRDVAERYISLANMELHRRIDNDSDDVWGIAGASFAIKERWGKKFGYFNPRIKAIRGDHNEH